MDSGLVRVTTLVSAVFRDTQGSRCDDRGWIDYSRDPGPDR